VVALVFSLVFGSAKHFAYGYVLALVVAEVVSLQCYAVQFLLRAVERAVRRPRPEPEARRPMRYYVVSVLFFPVALAGLGFKAGMLVSNAMGRPWQPPDIATNRVIAALAIAVSSFFFFIHRIRESGRQLRRDAEARIRELEKKTLEAQLGALAAEMNPHLLFNALNSIAALVHKDPDLAEEAVLKLGAMYRRVLETRGKAMHALADEIRLCEAYLEVERVRFSDRLRVAIEIDPRVRAADVAVPVVLVQPLVENAVRHGIAPRASGGTITVAARATADGDVEIIVVDDGVGLGSSPKRGNGMALANCQERLALAFAARARFAIEKRAEGGTRARVVVPAAAAALAAPASGPTESAAPSAELLA
jgi:LytS/YehU family sensor histidine kinase